MASDDNSVQVPRRAARPSRLREAWLALLGRLGADSGISLAAPSARGADLLQSPLIEALIGGLPNPAIVLDRAGRVIAFNEPAGSIAPALRRGEPALITLRMPELVDAIRRASSSRAPQRVEFFERVPLDRWFETFVTPVKLPGAEGPTDILLMTFNDLTPLRRVEEMRADFIANASHELRTPLAALLGFIETLQGTAKDDAGARAKFLAHHAGPGHAHGASDRRLVVAVAHRAQRPSTAQHRDRSGADRAPGRRRLADVGARPRRGDQGRAAAGCRGGARRPRRIDPRAGKSGGERAQIRRRRQAGRYHAHARHRPAPARRKRA